MTSFCLICILSKKPINDKDMYVTNREFLINNRRLSWLATFDVIFLSGRFGRGRELKSLPDVSVARGEPSSAAPKTDNSVHISKAGINKR